MRRLNSYYPQEKQLRNRSSKHLNLIIGGKSIFYCVSLDQLYDWVKKEVRGASAAYDKRIAKRKRQGKPDFFPGKMKQQNEASKK